MHSLQCLAQPQPIGETPFPKPCDRVISPMVHSISANLGLQFLTLSSVNSDAMQSNALRTALLSETNSTRSRSYGRDYRRQRTLHTRPQSRIRQPACRTLVGHSRSLWPSPTKAKRPNRRPFQCWNSRFGGMDTLHVKRCFRPWHAAETRPRNPQTAASTSPENQLLVET